MPLYYRFCRNVNDGMTEVSGEDFPIFLWAGGAYDPDHIEVGLLQGELLLQVRIGCQSIIAHD